MHPLLRRIVAAISSPGLLWLAVWVLVAPALSAQVRREERAHLSLAAASIAAGSTVHLEARIAIDEGWHVNAHKPTLDYLIPTAVTVEVPAGWAAPQLEYPASVRRTFAFADQPLDVYEGTVSVWATLEIPPRAGPGPMPLRAKLRYQACNDRLCLPPVNTEATATLQITAQGEPAAPAALPPGTTPAPVPEKRGFLGILALAFLGGFILNAMPCVLPVLSLKVFGLLRSAAAGRRAITAGSLATAAGIVVSFLGLATAAIAARAAGARIGWGIQFQEPGFVAFLAIVVVLFCLNLWGVFEIQLPSRLRQRLDGAQAAQEEGAASHFSSGLFATLMATPCSAPFLGTALGFALAQSAPVILAIFLAVGIGMAAPYFLLAAFPGIASVFPKPGAWMETLKGAMGFLLAGAVVWLCYVLAAQIAPEKLAGFQLALLTLTLLIWLASRLRQGSGRLALRLLALLLGIASIVWTGRGRAAALSHSGGGAAPVRSGAVRQLIDWQPWSEAEIGRLLASGKTVFVDVTADWCFTCKVNERAVLETEEVAGALARAGVVALRADWTNRDDAIADYLAKFGRSGIPFYAFYRPGKTPRALPELLSKDLMLREIAGTE